jgi:plasmid stability protein
LPLFEVAIIDCSDIIDCMASITIRRLPEITKRKLRIRAAQNGRSMEQEAREILRIELNKPTDTTNAPKTGKDLVEAIRRRFAPLGGVDLEIPPRGPIRDPGIR